MLAEPVAGEGGQRLGHPHSLSEHAVYYYLSSG